MVLSVFFALSPLPGDESAIDAVIQAGGINGLLNSLEDTDPMIQLEAAGCLSSVAEGSLEQIQLLLQNVSQNDE